MIYWNSGATIKDDKIIHNNGDYNYRIKIRGDIKMTGFIQVGDDDASTKTTCIVEIDDGVTGSVTLKNTYGTKADKTDGYADAFFRVRQGSVLIIQGKNDSQRIILDGGDTSSANISTVTEIIGSSGTLELNYVTIQNNENLSDRWAPAIKLNPGWATKQKLGTTTVRNCEFKNIRSNYAPVLFADNPGNISSNPVDNSYNTPTTNAILIQNTKIHDCSVILGDGRTATDAGQKWGGIIRFRGPWVGNLTLDNVQMYNNKAEDCSCAGVFWNAFGDKNSRVPTMTIKGCKFFGNNAKYSGGALRIETNCYFEAPLTEIYNNTAGVMGGGIHLYGYAGGSEADQQEATLNHYYLNENLYVHDNTAQYGGGLAFQLTSNCTMFEGSSFNAHFNGAKFDNNKATVKGAALYFEDISGKTKADGSNKYDVNFYINRGSISGNKVAPDPNNPKFSNDDLVATSFYDNLNGAGSDRLKSSGGGIFLYNANIGYEQNQAGEMKMDGNQASRFGGAITVLGTNALLNLQGLTASTNKAWRGGALCCFSLTTDKNRYASIKLGNLTLSGNTATDLGGGVFAESGNVNVLTGATIQNCKATNNGGGICCINNSVVSINNANINGNTANNGGGIYITQKSALSISSATFKNNTANNCGGAVECISDSEPSSATPITDYCSKMTVDNASFEENYAAESGGAIYVERGIVELKNEAKFTGNHALNRGGAIYSYWKSHLTIGKVAFEGNYVDFTTGTVPENSGYGSGGAIFMREGGYLTIGSNDKSKQTIFRNNSCKNSGGAIYLFNQWSNQENHDYIIANLENALFTGNSSYRGGALCLDGVGTGENVQVTLTDNKIENNTAAIGAGLLINECKTTYNGGLIKNNYAKKQNDSAPKTCFYGNIWDDVNTGGHDLSGFGGGIFISTNGYLSINTGVKFGIYGNRADIGGNDITRQNGGGDINIPDVSTLDIEGFTVPVPKSAVKWMEDYNYYDDYYSSGTNLLNGNAVHFDRYSNILSSAAGQKVLSKIIVNPGNYTKTENKYLNITLGYNFIFVKIRKEGLKVGDTAIFDISYDNAGTQKKYMTITLTNKSNNLTEDGAVERIVALTEGKWTVAETDWAWDYDRPAPQNKTLTIADGVAETMPVFAFTNSPKDKPAPNGEGYKINDGMSK